MTNQPGGYEHRRAGFVFKQLRADTAFGHYVEFVDETIGTSGGPARRRDAVWIVERAYLNAYPRVPGVTDGKSSAGIGTHAEQLPRKREHR